ncbi:hypothetical protein Q1695_011418 [Nippostrongylus brasiliensis]|nr:hypothetical protein Q1695_011418 [Nippostrongylus brasiliensis]
MFNYLSKIGSACELHCITVPRGSAIRDVNQKWYVSEDDYPYKYYPEYCYGSVCAATPDTISALVQATNTVPHLWIDDVWSYGIVAAEAGVSFRQLYSAVSNESFDLFLNGSVTARITAKKDGAVRFNAINVNLLP